MTTTTLRLPARIARLPQLRQIVRGGLAARGSIGAGLAATAGGAAAGVNWSQWFDYAWIFKSAASQSASYVDLLSSLNLTEYNTPSWNADSGMKFNTNNALKTGLLPSRSWSVMCRYSGATESSQMLFGLYSSQQWYIAPYWSGSNVLAGNFGEGVFPYTFASAGILGFAGSTCYSNGTALGTIPDYGYAQGPLDIWIGGTNAFWGFWNGFIGNIQFFGLSLATWTAEDVVGLTTEISAL